MTGRFRVALIGLPEGPASAIAALFRDSGFEPEAFDAASVDLREPGRFDAYDLLLVDVALGAGAGEERFVSFLLGTRGFLLFGGRDDGPGLRGGPFAVVHEGSSLEEILAAAQDVLYGGAVPGVPARKVPRIRVDLDVTYEYGDARHESKVRTLSENGAFIAALDPPPDGARVTVALTLPEEEERVVATGRALYNIGYDLDRGIISRPGALGRKIGAFPGFGVVFEEVSRAGREALRRFIEERRYGG